VNPTLSAIPFSGSLLFGGEIKKDKQIHIGQAAKLDY
jgi:hypothetical protein